jgi:fructoselysine-6-P-deglycase FrlB-like protein
MDSLNYLDITDKPLDIGHEILKKRLEQCPIIIKNMLAHPIKLRCSNTFDSSHFVVTGTGSSKAHAKFFVYLINQYTQSFAEFKALSAFSEKFVKNTERKTLVIFSQGLSPNSQLALACSVHFHHTILFTSTTIEGANQTGKLEAVKILQQLIDQEKEIVYFPIENEYSVLIRLIGPLAGYLACLQFVENYVPGVLPQCNPKQLLTSLEDARLQANNAPIQAILSESRKRVQILSSYPFSDFGQNLAYKFLEGLYWPMPAVWDYLQFSHGPFQEWVLDRSPIIILHGNTRTEENYLERTLKMLNLQPTTVWIVKSDLPICYRILEYEMVLNHFLIPACSTLKINQIDWPGKGFESPLYDIS